MSKPLGPGRPEMYIGLAGSVLGSSFIHNSFPSPFRTSPSTETPFPSPYHVQRNVLDRCRLLLDSSFPFRQRLRHDWLLSGWTPHWSPHRALDCNHHWYHFESGLRRRSILILDWDFMAKFPG
jgi:hypothetical protein